jgi:hypothetical protein
MISLDQIMNKRKKIWYLKLNLFETMIKIKIFIFFFFLI